MENFSTGEYLCAAWTILEAVGLWYFFALKPAMRWFARYVERHSG